MSFQHHVGSFAMRSGTGTQSITGVGFTPKVVWFFSAVTGGTADDYAIFCTGFDDGTTAWGSGFDIVDNDTPPQRVASSSQSAESIVRVNASVLTPFVMLAAHISAMTADGFTLTVTTNTASQNEVIHFIAFGGSDLDYAILQFAPSSDDPQVISGLSFAPKALIAFEPGTFGGVGVGASVNWTFVGTTGFCSLAAFDGSRTPTSECQRYLRNGRAFTAVTQSNNQVVVREADNVALTLDGFQIHWSIPSPGPAATAVLALGGAVSGSAAGVLEAEIVAGDQITTIPPIDPVAVLFGSVGHVASTTVSLDMNQMFGAANLIQTDQASWAGCLNGVATSVAAKGQSSGVSIYNAVAANPGSSSAVQARAALTALGTDAFTMTYETVASPAAIEVMYLALGTTAAPIPPPSGVAYPIRRVRVFPLPSENNLRMFFRRFELLLQAGVGLTTGQGSNPTFTVELSRDGGMTYGRAYVLTPGRLGEFTHRSILNQLGQYRNGTVRLAMSDPVLWAILDAFGDLETGTNWARG